MAAFRDTLDRVAAFELMGAPVGAGAMFVIAETCAVVAMDAVEGFIRMRLPIVSGLGLSILDRRFVKLERFIGDRFDGFFNVALTKRGIDQQINLSGTVDSFMRRLLPTGVVAGIATSPPAPAVTTPAQIPTPRTLGQIGLRAADVLALRRRRLEAYA